MFEASLFPVGNGAIGVEGGVAFAAGLQKGLLAADIEEATLSNTPLVGALLDYSKEIDANFDLLEKVISLNNKIRAEYNRPTERELEQNIGFNKSKQE